MTAIRTREKPACRTCSSTVSSSGRPPTGSIGFGVSFVNGRSRWPFAAGHDHDGVLVVVRVHEIADEGDIDDPVVVEQRNLLDAVLGHQAEQLVAVGCRRRP